MQPEVLHARIDWRVAELRQLAAWTFVQHATARPSLGKRHAPRPARRLPPGAVRRSRPQA